MRADVMDFVENLVELIPLVSYTENTGNVTEYIDEFGCVLFCVEVGPEVNTFHFFGKENEDGNYEKEDYEVSDEALSKIAEFLKVA